MSQGSTSAWPDLHLPTFFGTIAVTESLAFLAIYPLWYYKTLRQLPGSPGLDGKKLSLSKIFSFYRGYSTATIGFFPGNAAYLTVYEFTKQHSGQLPGLNYVAATIPAAGLAELSYIALAMPIENVIIRMMADERKRGWLPIAREVRIDRAYYRGTWATLLTAFPASCMWWPLYESFKLASTSHLPHLSHYQHGAVAAFSASMITTTLLHPIDTAKARMQSGRGNYEITRSVKGLLGTIIKKEGISACFRGLGPRLLLSQIEGVLWSISYEFLIKTSTARNTTDVSQKLSPVVECAGIMPRTQHEDDENIIHRTSTKQGSWLPGTEAEGPG